MQAILLAVWNGFWVMQAILLAVRNRFWVMQAILLAVRNRLWVMQACASASLCFFSLWTPFSLSHPSSIVISACFIVNKNEVLGGKIWWVWTNVMIWFMAFWYRFWCVLFDAISGLICWSYNRAAEIMWLFFLALLVQGPCSFGQIFAAYGQTYMDIA